jgi:uncharacterized protein
VPFPARLPARWLGNLAARLALASGVGYIAAAYTISRFMTRPRRKPLSSFPDEYGLNYRETILETSDQVRLSTWIVEPNYSIGTIALFHGMRHNRAQMLSRIQFLTESGFRCVVIDHRAHGTSTGKLVSFGWYEAQDVISVSDYINANWPDQPKLALGISMGAAAITFAGRRCNWDGIVLEGIYPELAVAFKRRIGFSYPKWFASLYPAVVWLTQKRMNVRIKHIQPVQTVRELPPTPILLITGMEDKVATVEDVDRVRVSTGMDGRLVTIPNAGHNNVHEMGGEEYEQIVLQFLTATIKKEIAAK